MGLFRNICAFLFTTSLLLGNVDIPDSSYLYFMGGDQEMDLFGGRDIPSFQMEYRPISLSYKIGNALFQPVFGSSMTTLPTLTFYGAAGYTHYLPKNQYVSCTLGPSARVVGSLYARQSRFELRCSPEYGFVTPTQVRFGIQAPIFSKMGPSGIETTDIGISFLLGIPLGKPRSAQESKPFTPSRWDF